MAAEPTAASGDGQPGANSASAAGRVREHLIGDRLEAKLAISTALKPEEHDIWAAEIRALQQVTPSRPYKAPDEKNSQRYFLGLTSDEQVAINSMHTRFTKEVNLACEKKYGSMTRYSPNADHSGQARYEQELHDNMQTPIDISTIEVAPLPSPYPKSRAQIQEERRAAQQASRLQRRFEPIRFRCSASGCRTRNSQRIQRIS